MKCQKLKKQQNYLGVVRLNVKQDRRGIMDEREDVLRKCKYCLVEYRATSAVQKYCVECIKFIKPLKNVFGLMLYRAGNLPTYKDVSIYKDWIDEPHTFIKWALLNGYSKERFIDRIDPFGSYTPDNCRWVTRSENSWNLRKHTTDLAHGTRCCYKCGIWKKMEEFYTDKTRPLGKHYKCKQCHKGE